MDSMIPFLEAVDFFFSLTKNYCHHYYSYMIITTFILL